MDNENINIAHILYEAYPHTDLLPINPEHDCSSLPNLMAKVIGDNLGDGLFRFIVVEIVEGGENTVERALNDLPYLISNAKQFIARPANKVPTFRDLMDEFIQLSDEFGDVTFDMENSTISINTESIELDDTYLGEFKIELHIDKLTETHRIAPYYVIALDPHPAATSSDVTHPHVSNDILCEGDGHTAICSALE